MGNLAKMAQQMQADMARVQTELENLQIEGSAGGGVVKAVVTGKQDIVSVTIDPITFSPSCVNVIVAALEPCSVSNVTFHSPATPV